MPPLPTSVPTQGATPFLLSPRPLSSPFLLTHCELVRKRHGGCWALPSLCLQTPCCPPKQKKEVTSAITTITSSTPSAASHLHSSNPCCLSPQPLSSRSPPSASHVSLGVRPTVCLGLESGCDLGLTHLLLAPTPSAMAGPDKVYHEMNDIIHLLFTISNLLNSFLLNHFLTLTSIMKLLPLKRV